MVSVAITGICSTLAQAILKKLVTNSDIDKIIGIDIHEYSGDFVDSVESSFCDIRDHELVCEIFEEIDVVIHTAFIVVTDVPDRKTIYDVNYNGTKSVIDAAVKSGVKTFICMSSVAAYGAPSEPVENNTITEESPLLGCENENWWYGYTKCLVEKYLNKVESQHPRIRIIRLRPHIISGSYFIENTTNLSIYTDQILGRRKIIWNIKPKNKVDLGIQLSHEEDIADIVDFSIKNRSFRGGFNIVGKPVKLHHYAKLYNKKVRRIPWWLVIYVPKMFSLFSSKLRKFSSWLDAVKIAVRYDSSRLIEYGYTKKLRTTQEILDEALGMHKE